ncbi:hypothetical protein OH492_23895 [Vibrio chagasii]|nr:hypothetical protein [Vibrio chagasii]
MTNQHVSTTTQLYAFLTVTTRYLVIILNIEKQVKKHKQEKKFMPLSDDKQLDALQLSI